MADAWLGTIGGVLTAAGKGALTGSALGPIGAAGGAALALAVKLVPDLTKVLGSDATAASKIVQTVQAVTGTPDPAGQAAATADDATSLDLQVQLRQIVTDHEQAMEEARVDALKASLADVASARAQTVQLAQAGSHLVWGAPVVSVVVSLGFFVAFGMMIFAPVQSDPGRTAMLNILVGVLGGGFTTMLNYWLGSSAGSARKSEIMAQREPIPPNPAVVVPAADVQPAK